MVVSLRVFLFSFYPMSNVILYVNVALLCILFSSHGKEDGIYGWQGGGFSLQL